MNPGERVEIKVDAYPGRKFSRHASKSEPGFRRALLAAAAGQRDRQLHQGGAAHPGAHPHRRRARIPATCCGPA